MTIFLKVPIRMDVLEVGSANFRMWEIFSDVDESLLNKIMSFRVYSFEGGIDRDDHLSCLFTTTDNKVYGVGWNDRCQLGVAAEKEFYAEPVLIEELCYISIIGIDTGSDFVVVLSENGSIFSWGNNRCGQLGTGEGMRGPAESPQPVVDIPSSVVAIACGSAHTLVLDEYGKVYSWGGNGCGQCGVEVYGFVVTPTLVNICLDGTERDLKVTAIACGRYHSAAITVAGDIYTWGMNAFGELGTGSLSDCYSPTRIQSPGEALALSCGWDFTLVLLAEGKVDEEVNGCMQIWACGANPQDSLGVGQPNLDKISVLSVVKKLPLARFEAIVSSRTSRLCSAHSDKGIYIWGLRKGCSTVSQHLGASLGRVGLLEVYQGRSTPWLVVRQVESLPILQPSLVIDVPSFYNNTNLSDMVIAVNRDKLACHSFILRWRCPHFGNLLEQAVQLHHMRFPDKVLTINRYSSVVYTRFIKYLYTGFLEPMSSDHLIELWNIAVEYFLDNLRFSTVRLFSEALSRQNCALLLNLTIEKRSQELEDVTRAFMESENIYGEEVQAGWLLSESPSPSDSLTWSSEQESDGKFLIEGDLSTPQMMSDTEGTDEEVIEVICIRETVDTPPTYKRVINTRL